MSRDISEWKRLHWIHDDTICSVFVLVDVSMAPDFYFILLFNWNCHQKKKRRRPTALNGHLQKHHFVFQFRPVFVRQYEMTITISNVGHVYGPISPRLSEFGRVEDVWTRGSGILFIRYGAWFGRSTFISQLSIRCWIINSYEMFWRCCLAWGKAESTLRRPNESRKRAHRLGRKGQTSFNLVMVSLVTSMNKGY